MSSSNWKPVRRLAVLPVVVAALFAAGAGAARADGDIVCGSTITTDMTLAADVLGCPADGLVIATDGITLDLSGHTLSGSGAGSGITITGANVTVKNGFVRGFEQGVRVVGIHGNGDHAMLTGLIVSRNGTGLFVSGPDLGTLQRSQISHNTAGGIVVHEAGHWTVEASRISKNGGDGISYFFAGATVTHNDVSGNAGSGILFLARVDGSTISGNFASRNAGEGIRVIDSVTNVLGNVAFRNQGTGILLSEGEGGLLSGQQYLIAGNVSYGNGGQGISACIAIPGNSCAPGMVDGGRNLALGNGQEPECVNIACRASLLQRRA